MFSTIDCLRAKSLQHIRKILRSPPFFLKINSKSPLKDFFAFRFVPVDINGGWFKN